MSKLGKRLLKQWLCHPLKDINAINDRLNAVADLIAADDLAGMWHITVLALSSPS